MYDIKPLEEEWKVYKSKEKRPYSMMLLGVILLAVVFVFFYRQNIGFGGYLKKLENKSNAFSEEKNILPLASTLINKGLVRLEILDIPTDTSTKEVLTSDDMLVDIPILDVKGKSDSKEVYNNKVHLNIIETSSISAYKDVEKRFLSSNDIDDALFLARSYYKKGNYKKSEFWSYEVNKIDSNLEEGLFIFIKSKFKLGRKNDALSILKNYLKKSNSVKAKNLLGKIENNKL